MLVSPLKSRRVCKVLARLIPLFEQGDLKLTYDELAKILGYTNRSGAHKAVKQLINLGIIERNSENGVVHFKLKGIIVD